MKHWHHEIDGSEIHLYPLVCWHRGAKQSDLNFIHRVISMIEADPLARWIYMGDGGECVTKTSKGNIYEQLMSPGDQLRDVAELLTPIRSRGLFGIRGNHGNRIDKDSGLGWDEVLCARIGIPYLGVSALGDIVLKPTSTQRLNVSVYTHHGSAGAITPAGKMAAGHRAETYIAADVLLTAHTHACGECWPPRYYATTDPQQRRNVWKRSRAFVCGSAYDGRTGYGEEKQYPPLLPEHIIIKIRAEQKNGRLRRIIKSEKIEGFEEDNGNGNGNGLVTMPQIPEEIGVVQTPWQDWDDS